MQRLTEQSLAHAEGLPEGTLFIDYAATASGSGYLAPSMTLEFRGRSTGEPASLRNVACDASGLIEGENFRRPGPA